MLASVSDLSEDFKDELRGIRKALEQQHACNVAIDEVVSAEVRKQFHTFVTHYIIETTSVYLSDISIRQHSV